LALHPTKCIWTPTQRLEALGLIVDTVKGTFELPPRRSSKIVALAKQLLGDATRSARHVKKRTLSTFAGCAQSAKLAVPYAQFHLQHVYDVISSASSWASTVRVRLSHAALKELRWWADLGSPQAACSKPLQAPPPDLQLWTDASNTGWGAALQLAPHNPSPPPPKLAKGFWSPSQQEHHITLKETMALTNAVRAFLPFLAGRSVLAHVDASVVVASLVDLTSHSPVIRSELQHLHHLLVLHDIQISAQYIAGRLNVVADALSRAANGEDWRLHPRFLQLASRLWSVSFTVDRFATALNAHCTKWNSEYYEPGSAGVDAFQQPLADWQREFNWMNPPWSLLPRLAGFLAANPAAHGVVAAPFWPAQPWYSALKSRAQAFYIIPKQPGMFASGLRGSQVYAPAPPWDVVLFRV
jgi:hypothetical protein